MTSYLGRHAQLYDLFYAAKPYVDEAAFVHEQLARHGVASGGRLLELACGTGTHALLLAEQGYAVTATDYSSEMLAVAKQKAEEHRAAVQFVEVDMRALRSIGDQFDAAVCLFDSIGYVQTDRALDEVFDGVRSCLNPGGVFVFEFWHAPAMLSGYSPVRVKRFQRPGGMVLRISETTLHPAESLASVAFDIYDLSNDRTFERIAETQVNRYFTVEEMQAWASRHAFLPLAFHSGFTLDLRVTNETWHVVAVWKKGG